MLNRSSSRSFLQKVNAYVIVGALGSGVHLFYAMPLYSPIDRVLACALLVICLRTGHHFANGLQHEPPIMVLVTLQFYVMYALPQFTQTSMVTVNGELTLSPSSITSAMFCALMGSGGFVLGYDLTRRRVTGSNHLAKLFPTVNVRWRRMLITYGILCVISSVTAFSYNEIIPSDLRNLILRTFNPYLAIVALLYLGYRFQDRLCQRVGVALILFSALLGLLSSAVELMLVPVYLFIMANWLWRRKVRVGWIAFGMVCFLILNPVKMHYRQATYSMESVQSSNDVAVRMELWKNALLDTWADPFGAELGMERNSSRTSGLLNFAQVIEWTPAIVPYQHGKGFSTALLFWVPRLLWRDKPGISDLLNNRYALDFQITTLEGIRHSTFGIVQPADGYWDFGVIGAIAYPTLLGIAIAFLFRPSRNPSYSMISVIFSAEFFQALAGLQYITATVSTLLAGSLIALTVIDRCSRVPLGVGVSGGVRVPRRNVRDIST